MERTKQPQSDDHEENDSSVCIDKNLTENSNGKKEQLMSDDHEENDSGEKEKKEKKKRETTLFFSLEFQREFFFAHLVFYIYIHFSHTYIHIKS